MSRPQHTFGPRKRTRADMAAGAHALLLNARDLDRITPELLVRCHGVKTRDEAVRMIAAERRRRG